MDKSTESICYTTPITKLHRTIVAAILLSKDNKILMGRVREGGVYPDCWHIPGGGVDEGEDKETALRREMIEEVGIDIAGLESKLVSDDDTGQAIKTDKNTGEKIQVTMEFFVYQVKLKENAKDVSISLDDDLEEYVWASKDELKDYKLTPPSVKLFSKLGWLNI